MSPNGPYRGRCPPPRRRRPYGRCVMPEILLIRRPSLAVRARIKQDAVARVAAADARRLHTPRRGQIGRAERDALHARRGGRDLLDVGHALRGLRIAWTRIGHSAPRGPRVAPGAGRRRGCPPGPRPSGPSRRRAGPDLRDQCHEIVEQPRRLQGVHPRPQRRVAEV